MYSINGLALRVLFFPILRPLSCVVTNPSTDYAPFGSVGAAAGVAEARHANWSAPLTRAETTCGGGRQLEYSLSMYAPGARFFSLAPCAELIGMHRHRLNSIYFYFLGHFRAGEHLNAAFWLTMGIFFPSTFYKFMPQSTMAFLTF